jgi:hypothetical protein
MSIYLATVTLRGRTSDMPGIPSRDLKGDLTAEEEALIFRAEHTDFDLAIPWEFIKECYSSKEWGQGIQAAFWRAVLLGWAATNDCLVYLTYYSAEHDMDVTIGFFVGNTTYSPRPEPKTIALAKAIWSARSEHLAKLHRVTGLHYR